MKGLTQRNSRRNARGGPLRILDHISSRSPVRQSDGGESEENEATSIIFADSYISVLSNSPMMKNVLIVFALILFSCVHEKDRSNFSEETSKCLRSKSKNLIYNLNELDNQLRQRGIIKNSNDYKELVFKLQTEKIKLNFSSFYVGLGDDESLSDLYNPVTIGYFMNCLKEMSKKHGANELGYKLSQISFLSENESLEEMAKEHNAKPLLKTSAIMGQIESLSDSELELQVTRLTILFACWPILINQNY
jgi:hypothetical protein